MKSMLYLDTYPASTASRHIETAMKRGHATKFSITTPGHKPFSQSEAELLRQTPGFNEGHYKKYHGYIMNITESALDYCLNSFPESQWSEPLKAVYSHLKQVTINQQETKAVGKTLTEDRLEELRQLHQFKTTPFNHQLKAFELSKDRAYFGLFMDMGTGKTKVGIDTMAYLWGINKIDAVLITAPNGVHRQWIQDQLKVHMPDTVSYKTAILDSKISKLERDKLPDFFNKTGFLKILAVNTDLFSKITERVSMVEKFLKSNRVLWILDESTRIKTASANRTKLILKLCGHADYRRILTGAPITQGLEDLYTQFKFLHTGIIGQSSYFAFKTKYCKLGGFENRQIIGYNNVDDLHKRLQGHIFQCKKVDCLDLPQKIYQKLTVELTEEQKKAYDQIKKQYLLDVGQNQVSAALAITRIMKLQQIVCGFIVDDEGKTHLINTKRPTVVKELLDDLGGKKVIIWCRYQNDIKILLQVLNAYNPVAYYGDTDADTRKENLDKFIADPSCLVFLSNPSVGGTGVDGLQRVCDTVIYYSNSFSAEDRWQSEDRVHRHGQTNSVTYIDLIAEKTIDEKIVKALLSKKSVAEFVMDNKMFSDFIV